MGSTRSAIPARPFLKWAGGKTQLLDQFVGLYPPAGEVGRYLEPFLGSGAVFFQVKALLAPDRAMLSDGNEELINVYRAVRDDVDGLIRQLRKHKAAHGADHYYTVRSKNPSDLSDTARAARMIYLNKTCFNGLYRVNSRGRFNVPIGRYTNPPILDEENLRRVSAVLRRVSLKVADFTRVASFARSGDFVYLDPPYHPLSDTSYFTSYTERSFGTGDQERLAGVFRQLHERGCRVMLSNSDTRLIRELFADPEFHIQSVWARRNINSRSERRGRITELVVTNYPTTTRSNTRSFGDEIGSPRVVRKRPGRENFPQMDGPAPDSR